MRLAHPSAGGPLSRAAVVVAPRILGQSQLSAMCKCTAASGAASLINGYSARAQPCLYVPGIAGWLTHRDPLLPSRHDGSCSFVLTSFFLLPNFFGDRFLVVRSFFSAKLISKTCDHLTTAATDKLRYSIPRSFLASPRSYLARNHHGDPPEERPRLATPVPTSQAQPASIGQHILQGGESAGARDLVDCGL